MKSNNVSSSSSITFSPPPPLPSTPTPALPLPPPPPLPHPPPPLSFLTFPLTFVLIPNVSPFLLLLILLVLLPLLLLLLLLGGELYDWQQGGGHMVHVCSSVRRHFGGKFGICRPGEEEEKRRRKKKRGGTEEEVEGKRGGGGTEEEVEGKRGGIYTQKFDTSAGCAGDSARRKCARASAGESGSWRRCSWRRCCRRRDFEVVLFNSWSNNRSSAPPQPRPPRLSHARATRHRETGVSFTRSLAQLVKAIYIFINIFIYIYLCSTWRGQPARFTPGQGHSPAGTYSSEESVTLRSFSCFLFSFLFLLLDPASLSVI